MCAELDLDPLAVRCVHLDGYTRQPRTTPRIHRTPGGASLRHSFVTAALDAGVSLRDVQDTAGHADPRTTRRYDRARYNLDRHATYAVTAFLADDVHEPDAEQQSK